MSHRLPALIILPIVWSVFDAAPSHAAEQYKAGDEVEVLFLGGWIPGKVVNTNQRGDVLADYEFAHASKQGVFKATEVRYPYEAGAIVRARVWNDSAGKFHQKAALIELADDSITLRKPDKTEIKVPIAKLADADQQFVKKLQREEGVERPPQPPKLEDFEGTADAAQSLAASAGKHGAIQPDPLPSELKLKQSGVGFPIDDFYDRLGAIVPVGGKGTWLLAALENDKPGSKLPTRLLWASLDHQKIEGRQLLPSGEVLLDYHSPTHRVLTFSTVKDESDPHGWGTAALTLWDVSPTDKRVKPLVRWKADSGERGLHEPWGRIIDADVILQRFKKQELVGWDTTTKKVRYRTAQESFFAPLPTISAGRKYLVIPEDKDVRILESATGNLVATLPARDGCSGVAISEDGRKVAGLSRNALTVWDLANPDAEPQRYQAEAIGTPFRAELFWVSDDRVMVDSGRQDMVLFSLKHKVSLWNYQFDMNAVSKTATATAHRIREIVNQHLVYGATLESGRQHGLAVGAVLLPGPQVEEVAASLDPESLIAIKPGTAVKLDVQAGENNARIQAALDAKIRANGWVPSPASNVVLIAEMKRGDQQTITYHLRPFGGGQETTQSATVTPYISSLRLMLGDKVAWQSGTSTGAPGIIMLKEGQTAQAEIDQWQHPNVEFFDKVEIPAKILDPSKHTGLGTTQVTNRGLIVAGKR
jgi:hypothetical protein